MIPMAMGAGAAAVSILVGSYSPPKVDVVAGDTVTWTNDSVRRHTVTADDRSWTSPDVFSGDRYSHEFDATGAYTYFCQVHPFMHGEVDVHTLLLDMPHEPGAPGRPYTLTGRSSLPTGTDVTIESGAGDAVAHTAVADDGTVRAAVTPSTSTTYRAVAGGEASPPVQLLVLDRTITATAARRHGRTIVRVRVTPASPHGTVVLQLHLHERFGWWPVRVKHLDHHSRATFRLRLHRRVAARAVLTLADAATPLARSGELRIGARSRRHR
jgi:Cupredoxin-like domain